MKPTKTLILRYLEETPGQTTDDLVALLGVIRRNVNRHLVDLHELRLARISSWDTVDRGFYGPVPVARWSLGGRRHAAKPKPKTGAELAKISREKLKAPDRMLARALAGPRKLLQSGAG